MMESYFATVLVEDGSMFLNYYGVILNKSKITLSKESRSPEFKCTIFEKEEELDKVASKIILNKNKFLDLVPRLDKVTKVTVNFIGKHDEFKTKNVYSINLK